MLFIRNTYIRNNENNHTVQNNGLKPQIKNRHKKTQLLYHNNLLKIKRLTHQQHPMPDHVVYAVYLE